MIGSGGREHALSWKLSQSDKVDKVFTAPGNGGTLNNVDISIDDLDGLAKFAKENKCFTVVGPEVPLAEGIVDKFNQMNLKIFGPSQKAAQLESSKIWAKEFMKRNQIPTARFGIPMASSQDHKRIYDNDKGPNTGGMGAYSPMPMVNDDLEKKIQEKIINKTIQAMIDEGISFQGFL